MQKSSNWLIYYSIFLNLEIYNLLINLYFQSWASNANLYKLGFRSLVMYPQSPLVRLFFNTATSIALRFISVSRHSPYAQDGNQILACRHDSSDFHFERMALFNTQKIGEPIRLSSNEFPAGYLNVSLLLSLSCCCASASIFRKRSTSCFAIPYSCISFFTRRYSV